MNERILELAKKAGLKFPSETAMSLVELKFAELIIWECLTQVQEQYKPVLEDEVMMKDTHWDGYVQCGVDSYVTVREHFYGEEELK